MKQSANPATVAAPKRRPVRRKATIKSAVAQAAPANAPAPPLVAFLRTVGGKVISFLRSAGIERRPKRIHMVERLALSSKHSVSLLRVDHHEFVVGYSGDSMVLLSLAGGQTSAVSPIAKEDLVRAFRRAQ